MNIHKQENMQWYIVSLYGFTGLVKDDSWLRIIIRKREEMAGRRN